MSSYTLPVSCNKDCGAGCPLTVYIENGIIVRIGDNPDRLPFMQGCPRGYQSHRAVYSPDRLTTPLIRTGERGSGEFRESEWDEALGLVADGLKNARDNHGPASIMHIGGSGSCRGAIHNTGSLTTRFFRLFGGFTTFSNGYSSAAEGFVNPYLFGTGSVGTDAETLLQSKMIILWGANISDTRFSCELENVIIAARKSGVPVIVIDPRKSRSVERLSTDWIPILPGSDTAMMAAILYVLLSDALVDTGFIQRCTAGFEELKGYILGTHDGQPKSPNWAEAICGVPEQTIADLARDYGRTKPTALIPGLSVQRSIGGEEAIRMAVALQAATGNIGILGGSSGSAIWGRLPGPRMPSIGPVVEPGLAAADVRRLPVYRWPDAVLEGTEGGYPSDIHCLYVVGGNYLNTGSDITKNVRAFKKADFSVCHELFMTPTAQYCDVVLPVTSYLEREDVVFPADNSVFYTARAADPVGASRNDYDILAALAHRLGFGDAFTGGRTASQWLERFIDESEIDDVDAFRRTGMYNRPERDRVAFADFVKDPTAAPLGTPSGLIEISSPAYAKTGFPPYPTARGFAPSDPYPLFLISPHGRYRINSQNSNDPWFSQREPPELTIHSKDASERGITDGSTVLVSNDRGSVAVSARVTDAIMPGVVCLPAGAWTVIDENGIGRGGSPNMVTSTEPTLPSHGSRTHAVGVQVQPHG
jgi:anaerobic dimethyl sulfoxide reductase subunit A